MRLLGRYKLKMLPDVFAAHIDHISLNSIEWLKSHGRLSRYNLKVGGICGKAHKLLWVAHKMHTSHH